MHNESYEAFLRRFDLKICLDYLTHQQVLYIFHYVLDQHGNSELEAGWAEGKRNKMDCLTPGYFMVVVRANKIFNKPLTTKRLIVGLQTETGLKL